MRTSTKHMRTSSKICTSTKHMGTSTKNVYFYKKYIRLQKVCTATTTKMRTSIQGYIELNIP